MDGDVHEIWLLDDLEDRKMRVHTYSSEMGLSLNRNTDLVVVGYRISQRFTRGVVVYGSTDGRFYYCENPCGQLQCSSVDTCPKGERGIDVVSTNVDSQIFTVVPEVLNRYSDFFRMCRLTNARDPGVGQLLGVAEVARSLGVRCAEEIIGGSSEQLLSKQHLRNVHNSLGSGRDPLQMPDDIKALVGEAAEALSLCDRKYERTRFGATQKTTTDFVVEGRRLAETTGNVGVGTTVSAESSLIKSCVVGALGMEPSLAIFHGFRRSRVNIDGSPGCTANYFPGVKITIAFPDGSATGAEERTFRSACPFTSELSETIGILRDLAPTIGKGRLRKISLVLSKELAADPSLVLDPVTETVVRSFGTSVDDTPAKHSLIELLRSSSLGGGRLHREVAMAGVLCQLGQSFSAAGGADMRCFFDCCREACWGTARGNVGEVLVDCKVDISACDAYSIPNGYFLRSMGTSGVGYCAKLTGTGLLNLDFLREGCQQGGNYHLESTDEKEVFSDEPPRPVLDMWFVGSSGTTA